MTRSQAARRHSDACAQGGIAEKGLKDQWNHDRGAVKSHAQHGHQEHAGGVGAILEHAQIDHRIVEREARRE